ncbi:hypothetical protein OQA88_1306 [Cercophora sp. LCS_1]
MTYNIWTTCTDWVNYALIWLRLKDKRAKLLFLGLDNAGKSTLLHQIAYGRLASHNPTVHPTSEEAKSGKIVFNMFDLGGHQQARRLWRDYFFDANAIMFLVDAKDRERFPEARVELHAFLAMKELENVPLAVMGNKIDDPKAVSESELWRELGLDHFKTRQTPVALFMCSVALKMGYMEGFKWIEQHI